MKPIKGLQAHRLKGHAEELAFAQAWEGKNERGKILAHLLDTRDLQGGLPPTPSDRDYAVAATVIQWLGSHVGECFLRDMGYVKGKI